MFPFSICDGKQKPVEAGGCQMISKPRFSAPRSGQGKGKWGRGKDKGQRTRFAVQRKQSIRLGLQLVQKCVQRDLPHYGNPGMPVNEYVRWELVSTKTQFGMGVLFEALGGAP